MKEIEKYIGYYLLVYLVVLAICGFFQYMSVCQGKSLLCAVTSQGITDILTVTAYVLTPIVAIIGFQSWKIEKQYDLEKSQAEILIKQLNQLDLEIHQKFYLLKPIHLIKENFVAVNSLKKMKKDLSQSAELEIFKNEFTLLNRIINEKINPNLIDQLNLNYHFFNSAMDEIEVNYLKYYDLINDDLKIVDETIVKELDFIKYPKKSSTIGNTEFRIIRENIYSLITTEEMSLNITDPITKEIKNSNITFNQYKKNYDNSINVLMDALVKIIKPQ